MNVSYFDLCRSSGDQSFVCVCERERECANTEKKM